MSGVQLSNVENLSEMAKKVSDTGLILSSISPLSSNLLKSLSYVLKITSTKLAARSIFKTRSGNTTLALFFDALSAFSKLVPVCVVGTEFKKFFGKLSLFAAITDALINFPKFLSGGTISEKRIALLNVAGECVVLLAQIHSMNLCVKSVDCNPLNGCILFALGKITSQLVQFDSEGSFIRDAAKAIFREVTPRS
jgi:hypothetical protein